MLSNLVCRSKFVFSNIYSTKACGAEQTTETNNSNKDSRVVNPNWLETNQWTMVFKDLVKALNLGLLRRNPFTLYM